MEGQPRSLVYFLVKHSFELIFFSIEAVLVVLFSLFTSFGAADSLALASTAAEEKALYVYYQHINVVIFLGFGFGMTFLRSNAWTSIGLNLLISVLVAQVHILSSGFWTCMLQKKCQIIEVNVSTLVSAEFCTGSVLIAFGGVLGKMSPLQLMTMALCQGFLYTLNAVIFYQVFEGVDAGGSITTHVFGAYFGLTTTWIMVHSSEKCKTEGLSHSHIFYWIGTLLLWVYLPSCNAVIAVYSGQRRAVINTVLALCGSTMATYLTSALFHNSKFCIQDVLCATLAGAVSIGSCGDLIMHPYGGLLMGVVSGIVCTLCDNKLTPYVQKKAQLFDTCGINNLHGIPGLIGAFASVALLGSMDDPLFEEVFGRSPRKQALMQLAGIGVSLGTAVIGGLLVGLFLKLKLFKLPHNLYNDDEWWDLREVEVEDEVITTTIRRRMTLDLQAAALVALNTQPDSPSEAAYSPGSSDSK